MYVSGIVSFGQANGLDCDTASTGLVPSMMLKDNSKFDTRYRYRFFELIHLEFQETAQFKVEWVSP